MSNHMKILMNVKRVKQVISHGRVNCVSEFGIIVICDGEPFFIEWIDSRDIERLNISWQTLEECYCFEPIDDDDPYSYYPMG